MDEKHSALSMTPPDNGLLAPNVAHSLTSIFSLSSHLSPIPTNSWACSHYIASLLPCLLRTTLEHLEDTTPQR